MAYISTSKTRNTASYKRAYIIPDQFGINIQHTESANVEELIEKSKQQAIQREKDRNERERSFRSGENFHDLHSYVESMVHND